jgi:hypothetical protein
MSISIWDYEKPLDAMMLNHDHMAALVLKHEQQIKDLAAHLLELKQSTAMFNPGMSVTQGDVTPIMQFKRREWVGLTAEDMADAHNSTSGDVMMRLAGFARAIEAMLREKNT